MDENEIQRLAGAMNQLRPEWKASSLRTFLTNHFADRAYRDCILAAGWICADTKTVTPELMRQHGPWWVAAQSGDTPTPGPGREPACDRVGHEHELARNCRACAAERLADTEADVAPLVAVEPPAAIVEVANRHRLRSAPVTRGDRFVQVEELRPPDNFNVIMCARYGCGGYFVNDPAGQEAHQAVFGHAPLAQGAPGTARLSPAAVEVPDDQPDV